MLGRHELQQENDYSGADLLKAMTICKERAEIGKKSEARFKTVNEELLHYQKVYDDLRDMINYITQEYKNIEQFLIDKKEDSVESLKLAIEKAGYLIPDADITGIHLQISDKSAKLVEKKGQDLNVREGSGFRAVMGFLLVYTLIKFQPDGLQVMFLDEVFNTISLENLTKLREFIDIFKEDILIVGIEQVDLLFNGIEKTVYNVRKDSEGVTTVVKERDEEEVVI